MLRLERECISHDRKMQKLREIEHQGEKLCYDGQGADADDIKTDCEQFLQSEGISYKQDYNVDESGLL